MNIKINTFCKAITFMVIMHGVVLVTMSYVLSWFGRETVSDVSVVLVSEIVAPLCTYIVSNCVANIFERNKLSFSTPLEYFKGIVKDKEIENDTEFD